MMVIFGGRTTDQSALKDTWGLRRHRDGRWDWVKAPYKPNTEEPLARYQHSTIFVGTLMIVLGGRTNNVGENVQLEVYETESSEWRKFTTLQRFRHTVWAVDANIFMHGGFENETPNIPTNTIVKLDLLNIFKGNQPLLDKLKTVVGPGNNGKKPNDRDNKSQGENRSTDDSWSNGSKTPPSIGSKSPTIRFDPVQIVNNADNKLVQVALEDFNRKQGTDNKLGTVGATGKGNGKGGPGGSSVDTLYSLFLNHLLRPREWNAQFDGNGYFAFRREHIIALAEECQKVLEDQPMVLRVDAPIKVFGDIHGQYQDLMRFFDLWSTPSETGDIECFDYLFLGDYVDRGSHSLETICLLMALKVKYPDKIHLLRGNHEDKWINNAFGFAEECSHRLGEDPAEPDSVFNKINDLFDWLPLAAVIEDKIVCLHGGIGSTLVNIEQIEMIQRPLEVIHEVSTPEQQLVVDILWSDPTDND